jgi:hypothetical protein
MDTNGRAKYIVQTSLETVTLSQAGWNRGSACRVDRVNIPRKFHENHPRGSEDMNRTRNASNLQTHLTKVA